MEPTEADHVQAIQAQLEKEVPKPQGDTLQLPKIEEKEEKKPGNPGKRKPKFKRSVAMNFDEGDGNIDLDQLQAEKKEENKDEDNG